MSTIFSVVLIRILILEYNFFHKKLLQVFLCKLKTEYIKSSTDFKNICGMRLVNGQCKQANGVTINSKSRVKGYTLFQFYF